MKSRRNLGAQSITILIKVKELFIGGITIKRNDYLIFRKCKLYFVVAI